MASLHVLYLQNFCSRQRKFAHSKEKLLTNIQICSEQEFAQKICSQQKFAHRICSQHRKIAHDEKPCRLGWINTRAKFLASSQSEHDWRALLYGLSLNGWNVLGPDLPVDFLFFSFCHAMLLLRFLHINSQSMLPRFRNV